MHFGLGSPNRVAAKTGSASLVPAVEIVKQSGPPDQLTALAGYQAHKKRGKKSKPENLSEG